jgi:hypothetical protein
MSSSRLSADLQPAPCCCERREDTAPPSTHFHPPSTAQNGNVSWIALDPPRGATGKKQHWSTEVFARASSEISLSRLEVVSCHAPLERAWEEPFLFPMRR